MFRVIEVPGLFMGGEWTRYFLLMVAFWVPILKSRDHGDFGFLGGRLKNNLVGGGSFGD